MENAEKSVLQVHFVYRDDVNPVVLANMLSVMEDVLILPSTGTTVASVEVAVLSVKSVITESVYKNVQKVWASVEGVAWTFYRTAYIAANATIDVELGKSVLGAFVILIIVLPILIVMGSVPI